MTGHRIAAAGALLAALGIALGAFGAHALQRMLEPRALEWWHTAVQYQMWNAVGLLALGALPVRAGAAALLIGGGTLIFSGALYVMALTDARWLGMVTPVGGLLMIAGWLLAAWKLARR
ncbi:MAG TPA: DUF423 domain-containing protein [Allosphingosinicella sp.]|nr:DUF423 domain-containing protein [Allosphingosinicella sp.]